MKNKFINHVIGQAYFNQYLTGNSYLPHSPEMIQVVVHQTRNIPRITFLENYIGKLNLQEPPTVHDQDLIVSKD